MATPDQLRQVLLSPEEAREMDAVGGRLDAAVLVPLYLDSGALHAVVTASPIVAKIDIHIFILLPWSESGS